MTTPSINGDNGRDQTGRFVAGNRLGQGNPHIRKVSRLRSMLLNCVSDEDFQAVIAKLVEEAKQGELGAIRELLDRMLGKPERTLSVGLMEEQPNDIDAEIESVAEQILKQQEAGRLACVDEPTKPR